MNLTICILQCKFRSGFSITILNFEKQVFNHCLVQNKAAFPIKPYTTTKGLTSIPFSFYKCLYKSRKCSQNKLRRHLSNQMSLKVHNLFSDDVKILSFTMIDSRAVRSAWHVTDTYWQYFLNKFLFIHFTTLFSKRHLNGITLNYLSSTNTDISSCFYVCTSLPPNVWFTANLLLTFIKLHPNKLHTFHKMVNNLWLNTVILIAEPFQNFN